ncbi:MAG: metallophosphoesterase [Pelobacteraceae bacterium]
MNTVTTTSLNISRRQFLKTACQLGSIGLVASYPVFIERLTVLTNEYRIAVPNLPAAFSGFRIVHLSDIHYGRLTSLSFIKGIVERANNLKPDLIACTGDYVYVTSAREKVDAVWQVLSQLTAPCGVWSVLGNHDHWTDTERSDLWLKKSGQNLRHKAVRIERSGQALWFAGAGDFITDHRNLDPVLEQIPDPDCRVVLAHNPDTADTVFKRRIDLMLAGHTHGGQVRVPFMPPLYNPVLNKNYVGGITASLRGFPMFISRGIGWTFLPIRFNCYPEIAVLELVPHSV